MTIYNKILKFILLTISCSALVVILLLSPVVQNFLAFKIFQSFAKTDKTELISGQFSISSDEILFKDGKIKIFDEILLVPKLSIKYNLFHILKKGKTHFSFFSDELSYNNDQIIFKAKLDGQYSFTRNNIISLLEVSSSKINENINFFKFSSGINFESNNIKFSNSIISIDNGEINFDLIATKSKNIINSLDIKGDLKNIPTSIYRVFLSKGNGVYDFMEEGIKDTNISYGDFNIKFDDETIQKLYLANNDQIKEIINKDNINAKFIFDNIEYTYKKQLPKIFAKNLPLEVAGSSIHIDTTNLEIAGSRVIEGSVKFDYIKDKKIIKAEAKAQGTAKGLMYFIDQKQLNNLAESNVDLTKITGTAYSDVKISIPLFEEENTYDVSTRVENVNFSFMSDKLKMSKYLINGKFNGNKIALTGKGFINGFNSSTDIIVNIDENPKFTHKIDSIINLSKNGDKIPGIIFLSGGSNLNVNILSDEKGTRINLSSNLRDTHFQIPPISLDKQQGNMANLHIAGFLSVGKNQRLNIKLAGQDNLKIKGYINSSPGSTKLEFTDVKYLNSDFKIDVLMKDKKLTANVHGELLDLSDLKSSESKTEKDNYFNEIILKIKLDKVRLKNNIVLTNNLGWMECNNGICPIGRFSSSFSGKDFLIAEYSDNNSKPFWYLETNEASSLLRGLGVSNNIVNGYLTAKIDAPIFRNDPEYFSTGELRISKFKVKENRFLAKIVSFISLPGLVNSLSNNDIPFDLSETKFKLYKNKIIIDTSSNKGPYFNLFATGKINLSNKNIKLSGQVVPSLYGLNKLAGSLPLIRGLFGSRGGILMAPFIIEDKY